jgi:hypothetical protein
LLIIFASKDGRARSYDIEKFRHHGGYAIKMAWSTGTAKAICETADPYLGGKIEPVHGLGRGGEDQSYISSLELSYIVFKGSRVAVIVFVWAELRGVYKNSDHREFAFSCRCVDKGKMTLVERSHGWNQRDAMAGCSRGIASGANSRNFGCEYRRLRHDFLMC